MADIRMMSAFGTVPGDAQEGILRVLRHALETIAQEDNSFTRAKAVFTESDEQCVFTVELDAGKKAPTPLVLTTISASRASSRQRATPSSPE